VLSPGEGAGANILPESGLATSQLYGHCLPVTMLCLFEPAHKRL